MFDSSQTRPPRHTRSAVEGGGARTCEVERRQAARADARRDATPDASTQANAGEGLFVAGCLATSIVLWGMLLWVLATALQVPSWF